MRKTLLFLAASAVVASASSTVAATGPVQRCYQLGPFVDELRLIQNDKVNGHQFVYGSWSVSGGYVLPVAGAYDLGLDGVTRSLSLVGTNNNTADFGGNQICGLEGTVDGSWALQCSGGTGSNFQNTNSTLTQVSCRAAPLGNGQGAGRGN